MMMPGVRQPTWERTPFCACSLPQESERKPAEPARSVDRAGQEGFVCDVLSQ